MNASPPAAKPLFLAAIRLAPDAWPAFLDEHCGADVDLRRMVEGLLAAHARSATESPAEPSAGDSTAAFAHASDDSPGPGVGTAIGPYTLREQIGEGGMGLVFVAEQMQPVRRKVALKVIKPGMDTRQVVARFEAERQALALMDHPNIARVLDAGTTPEGRPFFVMELVKGEPITDYCDHNRLNLRQRLELFLQVCQAVQHAHQKGVIHRDLKPSNVLIAVHDVTPVAKVIDFGIAKAVGQSLTDKTMYTAIAQFVGTPLYMSPEQAGQSSLDVDTRTDVYALGVLLYELLTGTTPIDPETVRKAGLDEVRRIIREDEPPRPSARMSTLKAAALLTVAEKRAADPRRLARQVRGELDWVVMKCLEKDRNRRYETASSLAADVQRFLADEPVAACPPSAVYRLRKFTRRNQAALVTLSLVAIALVAGTAVSVWQAIEADRARKYADERLLEETKAKAEKEVQSQLAAENYKRARAAVKQMLTRVATDEVGQIPEMKEIRRKLLEDAIAFYTQLLRQNPRDAETFADRASVFNTLGRDDEAVADYRMAVELEPDNAIFHDRLTSILTERPDYARRDHHGALVHSLRAVELEPKNFRYRMQLAVVYCRLERTADARAVLATSLPLAQSRSHDTEHMLTYIYIMLGDHSAALPHARTCVELDPTSSWNHRGLGVIYAALGDDDKALTELNEAVRLIVRPHDAQNQYTFNDRGDVYMRRKQYAAALADYNRAAEVSPDFSFTFKRRAVAYFHLGNYPAALTDIARAVELNPDDASTITWIGVEKIAACPDPAFRRGMIEHATRAIELTEGAPDAYAARAALYAAMNEDAKAREDWSMVEMSYRRKLAEQEGNPGTARDDTSAALAGILALRGHSLLNGKRYAEAEPLLRECLTIRETVIPKNWLRFNAMSLLGGSLLGQGKYAEAEPLLLQGYEGMKQREGTLPAGSPRLIEAVERLVQLYEATNQPEKAAAWRANLPPVVAPPPRLKP